MNVRTLAFVLLCAPGLAQAYSFAGDWTFNFDATFNAVTILGNSTIPEAGSDLVSVSQTTTDAFTFPFALGPISGSGDFSVSGTTATDVNGGQTTDPFFVDFNGTPLLVRITYPTWNLIGDITGVNNGVVDGFGARAFEITGRPTLIENIIVEAFVGSWVEIGDQSSLQINSWSMVRDAEPVPGPSLMIASGLGIAALLKRKRKN
ncbi:MAG: hypothetical protein KF824_07095 [Fimbriimonadaceae bacterium]|nr:MAG: hypothetical protein KF824_07095 [Fimbriimonadaceae bacterium]